MKFTKAQRHEIYKAALISHKKDIKDSIAGGLWLSGMCVHIRTAARLLTSEFNYNFFPELLALKPKNATAWWWSTNRYSKTRLRKFALIIKQTAPKNRKTNGY